MEDYYYLGAICGQYLLLLLIYRDTSACKEAIRTLKEWKEDAEATIRRIEIEHAINHGRTPMK